MALSWPHSRMQVLDLNGRPQAGALATVYDSGTTTKRTLYADAALTTPRANPITADAQGRWPRVYLAYGSYKERVTTSDGALLWEDDAVDNPAPPDPAEGVDTQALLVTGDFVFSLGTGNRDGFVRANGRSIGNAASGATERANADTEDLFTHLWNGLADAQAAVSGGRGSSAAADFAANKTIALPDARATALMGLDDMGSSAASRLPAAVPMSGASTTAGSVAGANTHALTEAQLAAHTHSITGGTDAQGSHSHTLSDYYQVTGSTGSGTFADGLETGVAGLSETGGNTPNTTSTAGSHSHNVSGTAASTGGDEAHNNVPRALLGTWYVKL